MDRSSWHYTGGSDQDHRQEKEMQKGKRLSDEAFQIAEKRRETTVKGEKDMPIWIESSKEQQGETRKPSSVIDTKK